MTSQGREVVVKNLQTAVDIYLDVNQTWPNPKLSNVEHTEQKVKVYNITCPTSQNDVIVIIPELRGKVTRLIGLVTYGMVTSNESIYDMEINMYDTTPKLLTCNDHKSIGILVYGTC